MAKQKKVKGSKRQLEICDEYSDEIFAFTAGFTSGGAPYGLTWEELGVVDEEKNESSDLPLPIDDGDLPF